MLALVGARGASWSGLTVLVPPTERPLYASLGRLPKDASIAGFPGFAIDNVPYLARRSALVTRETHMPFHSHFTDLMRRRMLALVAGYFATGRAPLETLRDEHGVTHLIVDRRHFESAPPYFAPFGAEVARAFERGKDKGFLLLQAFDEQPSDGPLVVVDLSRL